jgi:hypothetical protein
MATNQAHISADSSMSSVIERFSADLSAIERKYPNRWSSRTIGRMEAFYRDWLNVLRRMAVDRDDRDEVLDAALLGDYLNKQLLRLETQREQLAELQAPLPFLQRLFDLDDNLRSFEWVDPEVAARELNSLRQEVEGLRSRVKEIGVSQSVAYRAANVLKDALEALKHWLDFYEGYDPLFTWWCKQPYEQLREGLNAYRKSLLENVVGISEEDTTTIVGDPIGRLALMRELESEHIPYTPEELMAMAEKEYAWCLERMLEASRELGFGDDWRGALEHVKEQHVEPGEQPKLIRDLALEAIAFLEERDLLTIPPLAKETWRMEMMPPQRQLESPFFLGGETILVSYPTDGMSHEAKLMSMRGNNRHFARATVHHELIPGHHLQGFMTQRFHPYRRLFSTPFWTEGWALYWEFLLWEKGFPKSPEDRIGMLFWRMHRCARIVFSLSFHLGKMSARECVDYLVEKVGHERDNASAEVRRSFGGSYPPLYQCAYMLGALQFRRMRQEIVESGRMTEKEFHDRVLQEGNIPPTYLRSHLLGLISSKECRPEWRFYD